MILGQFVKPTHQDTSTSASALLQLTFLSATGILTSRVSSGATKQPGLRNFSSSRRPAHGLPCHCACDFRGSNLVLEELVECLHELLRRARLDNASVWQAVAEQLAEAPGLPDYYTSGLLDY